jgi:hypothetical protein
MQRTLLSLCALRFLLPDGGALNARVAAGALAALTPGGAALVVSARPTELLTAMRNALATSTHDDADDAACADAAASDARLAASLAAARVVALNAGGAGVLILRRA